MRRKKITTNLSLNWTNMHKLTKKLQQFYNQNAEHFSQTRKKHWPEFDYIIEKINAYPWKKIVIRELGCGDGRFYNYLIKNCSKQMNYTGIDIADKLLDIAKKNNPKATFVHADMVDYIQKWKQESVDIIVSIASFQHIPTVWQRMLLLKNIYRLLTYEWEYIMTNRTLSERFIKRYRKALCISLIKTACTLGQHVWKDMFIPRQNKGKKQRRYYHMYSEKECDNLGKQSWFIFKENRYSLLDGHMTDKKKYARNMITILQKSAFTGGWEQ